MKILLIGGSGFIGTELTGILLEKGHDVSIFDLNKSKKYPKLCSIGDVRDPNAVKHATMNKDIVYFLAAEHADNVTPVSLYYDVNVGGAKNIAAAAAENNIKRLVYTSSGAVYGLDKGAVDESMTPDPFNDYGKSKLESEVVLSTWANGNKDRSLVILRPTVIFGEDNRGNVYNLFRQIKQGPFAMIGDGKNKKSLGYVKNIAAFMEYLIQFDNGIKIFNYADHPDMSMRELVSVVRKQLGKDSPPLQIPFWAGLTVGYCFDILSKGTGKKFPISSIRIKKFCEDTILKVDRLKQTGFKAPYSLSDAIRKTISHEFLKQNA
jgi:nucleoside-diphosphate-sugar epimerase